MFPAVRAGTPRDQRPHGIKGLLYKASVIGAHACARTPPWPDTPPLMNPYSLTPPLGHPSSCRDEVKSVGRGELHADGSHGALLLARACATLVVREVDPRAFSGLYAPCQFVTSKGMAMGASGGRGTLPPSFRSAAFACHRGLRITAGPQVAPLLSVAVRCACSAETGPGGADTNWGLHGVLYSSSYS